MVHLLKYEQNGNSMVKIKQASKCRVENGNLTLLLCFDFVGWLLGDSVLNIDLTFWIEYKQSLMSDNSFDGFSY